MSDQLISYIAPAAPATRRPAEGTEPFLRPEVGFTPAWYRRHLGIDFGRRWHTDPAFRRETVVAMQTELKRRFADAPIGHTHRPLDLLTGTYGVCAVAGIYGLPIIYTPDGWPDCQRQYLSDRQLAGLEPPDLDTSPFFGELMAQVDWIATSEGRIEGYVNWQGVLNNAQRLRGQQLLIDVLDEPDKARHLFECICSTMINAARRLHARQRESGVEVGFFTVSNCLVNMLAPEQYAQLLLPFDRRIAEAFGTIGIHNCAWTADPYIDHYATVPRVGYVDMGKDSDLRRARDAFPNARRAIMYTPMDLVNKPLEAIREDFRRIARDYGPCDIVLADIDAAAPDERIRAALAICEELSQRVRANTRPT